MYETRIWKPELWADGCETTNEQWKVENDTNIKRKITPRKLRPRKKDKFLPNNRNVNSRTKFVKG